MPSTRSKPKSSNVRIVDAPSRGLQYDKNHAHPTTQLTHDSSHPDPTGHSATTHRDAADPTPPPNQQSDTCMHATTQKTEHQNQPEPPAQNEPPHPNTHVAHLQPRRPPNAPTTNSNATPTTPLVYATNAPEAHPTQPVTHHNEPPDAAHEPQHQYALQQSKQPAHGKPPIKPFPTHPEPYEGQAEPPNRESDYRRTLNLGGRGDFALASKS